MCQNENDKMSVNFECKGKKRICFPLHSVRKPQKRHGERMTFDTFQLFFQKREEKFHKRFHFLSIMKSFKLFPLFWLFSSIVKWILRYNISICYFKTLYYLSREKNRCEKRKMNEKQNSIDVCGAMCWRHEVEYEDKQRKHIFHMKKMLKYYEHLKYYFIWFRFPISSRNIALDLRFLLVNKIFIFFIWF